MRTAILIDSGCDVSQELVQRYHMKVMHLHIIYPERDYIDGVDILPETMYRLIHWKYRMPAHGYSPLP